MLGWGPFGCGDPAGEVASTTRASTGDRPAEATPGCHVGGCAGQVCSAVPGVITPCDWQAHYGCLSFSSCGAFGPGGACGWKRTPAMADCLAGLGR